MLRRFVGFVMAAAIIGAQLAAAQYPTAPETSLNSWWGNPQQMYPTTVYYAEVVLTPSSQKGFRMTADQDGSIISAGRFINWASIGPFNLTAPVGNTFSQNYIIKQGPDGEYLWAVAVIQTDDGNMETRGLTTDAQGNIYLVTPGRGTVSIGGESTIAGTNPNGLMNSVVAKLDPSGKASWLKPFSPITARGLAADPTGQYLYMVGVSAESVDFDGYSFTNVGSGANMYLVKMSTADGTVQWAQQYAASSGTVTDTFAAAANFISIDSAGDVYLAGFYTNTFDTGLGSFGPLISEGNEDIFVIKVSSSGNTLAARSFGGFGTDEASDIRVGPQGTVYVLGRSNDAMDIPTNPVTKFQRNTRFQLSGNNLRYIWVFALDSSLVPQTAQQYGSSGNPYEAQMWVDAKGYVYVGGDFTGAVMSVGNQFVNNHFDSARDEIYIFKLDPSLNVVWARSFGNGDTDEILSLAANDLFVFFTGTGKAEYAGGPPQVVTGPVYLDAYPLVGILGASFPFIGIAYANGNAGSCGDLGLVKVSAPHGTAPGKSLRVQVAIRDRQGRSPKPAGLLKNKDAAQAADAQGLLVSLTFPAGVTYGAGKVVMGASKMAAYNATVDNGVVTWRGPAPRRGKSLKFTAPFTLASSGVEGFLYFTAYAQRLNGAGAPTCTTPTTTAEVKVKAANGKTLNNKALKQ